MTEARREALMKEAACGFAASFAASFAARFALLNPVLQIAAGPSTWASLAYLSREPSSTDPR